MANALTAADHAVERYILPNGLTVLLRRDRTAPVVAIVTYVRAGYFDETDDVSGIAHVLEHMYFKGTPSRGVGEIARQTKASGGYLNAATIYDHTRYYAVLPSSGFEAGLAIQADAYANSLIEAGELARELEVIIQEAHRKADSPEAVTTETLFELLHDAHRIRRWRIGREPGLRALTREHLLGFYRNFYRPRTTILSIVGDIDSERALDLVRQHYGRLPDELPQRTRGPEERSNAGRRYRHLAGDVANWHAAFGWRTPDALHPDTAALDLAGSVLSSGRASRLYRAVRERRLATGVSAWNYTPTELGVFVVQLEGAPERIDDALHATWHEVARLGESITPTEVRRAQRLFEARQMRRLETMEGQANYLADWEALGGWERGEAYATAISAATADDIAAAARRHLDPGAASLLVYEPASGTPWAIDTVAAFARLDRPSSGSVDPSTDVAAIAAPAIVGDRLQPEGIVQDVCVFRTRGDVPVLVRRRRGAPIVHLGVYATGGAASEPAALAGLGLIMARAAVKETRTRDAATTALQAELLGGAISASISSDGLGWGFSVPTRAFAEAVTLLADVVCDPAFTHQVVDTERDVARTQLDQVRDDMYRYPTRLALQAAFGDHPYARGSIGTDDGLARLTPDDVRAWHAAQVLSGNLVIAVVGDVDPSEAASMVAGAFAAVRQRDAALLAVPAWTGDGRQQVEFRDKAQTALCMAFPAPARRDPARHDAHLVSVIASGLGGRFFDALREKQSLAYTVHVAPSQRATAGMMVAYIATSPDKEDAAREGLLREFRKLQDEPVTAEELERARTYAIGAHQIAQQGSGHVLGEVIDAWVHGTGLDELADVERRLHAVTPASIQALAQRSFGADQRVEGVVRGRRTSA
ncbi:MAG: insulinase family protein [Gemmatimonadaceae bacterium]|nr:insulinase family protein [Gemmatimonadaceae bacterium]